MTPISASDNKNHQQGVTLFELLIVLVLIGFMTAITSANIGNSSEKHNLSVAAQQMRADFIRARIKANSTNSIISIYVKENGYSIPDLKLERIFSRKITLTPKDNDTITLGSGAWLRAHTIRLHSGNISTSISISPLTRKVEIYDER